MPRVDGFKQALQMLSGLDFDSAQKLIQQIAAKDPAMAEKLQNNLITIDDLQFITQKMLVELLREIQLHDLALALRLAQQATKQFIVQNVSSSMAREIREVIEGPAQPRSKVNEALNIIMQVVRIKVAKKELIIDKSGEQTV